MIPAAVIANQIEAAERQAHLENKFGSLHGVRVDSRSTTHSVHVDLSAFTQSVEKGTANVTALVASGVSMAVVEVGSVFDSASVVVHGASLTAEVFNAFRGAVVTVDVSGVIETRDPSVASFAKIGPMPRSVGALGGSPFLLPADKVREIIRAQAKYSFADKSTKPGTDSVFKLRATGQVKALLKLRELWELADDQMSILLGYQARTGKASMTVENTWRDVAELRVPMDSSVDRVDRVRMLTKIDGLLYGLYGNVEGPRKWLRHPVGEFNATPLDFMLQGSLRRLYIVADYLQGLSDPPLPPRQT